MRLRVFSTLNLALPYVLSEFRSRGPCECKEGSTPQPSSSDRALFLDVALFDSPPISSLSAGDGEDGCAAWVSDLRIDIAFTQMSAGNKHIDESFILPIADGIIVICVLLCFCGLAFRLILLVRFWLRYHVHICEQDRDG